MMTQQCVILTKGKSWEKGTVEGRGFTYLWTPLLQSTA